MTRLPARAWGLASGGPQIGRQEGQRLARSELGEKTFWQRVIAWIARLWHGAGSAVPRGWFGLIVLVIVLAAAIILVLFWVRPARARRVAAKAVLTGERKTARDYRQAAERLAAAGNYGAAIVERVRAVAAELDERGILPPRPGRTADELALEAGRELPDAAEGLRTITRLFDDIRYGDKEGTEAGYQTVLRVDAEVRSARTVHATTSAVPDAMAGAGAPL